MGKFLVYGMEAAPPVRAVLLTLKCLDLPYEYKEINLLNYEHKTKDFLDINPEHTVPTLVDDDHVIVDSHAIMAYLVRRYAKDDALYPKDFFKRALVDRRLHFDSCVAYRAALRNIMEPLLFKNVNKVPQEKIDKVIETYALLELFLKEQPYMAGEELTIADFSLVSTVTSLTTLLDIDEAKYPKLIAWIKRLEGLPYYQDANGKGAQNMLEMVKSRNLTIVP